MAEPAGPVPRPANPRKGGLAALLTLSLLAFALMTGLGLWQLQRLAWKLDLIHKLDARRIAKPLDWPAARVKIAAGEDIEYLRVRVAGRFLHDEERHLYATGSETWGWQVITPLEIAPGEVILVNRGFVPDAEKERTKRRAGLPLGTVEITGLLRRPPAYKPWASPDNEPARNRWYWLDLPALASTIPAPSQPWTGSVSLEAEATPGAPTPNGGITRLDLANRHLEYALTWFALTATLAVVLAVFLRQRGQARS